MPSGRYSIVHSDQHASVTAVSLSLIKRVICPVSYTHLVGRASVHSQPLRGGQNDIIFKLGINKGLDVLFRPPAGCAVLRIVAELLGLFRLAVDQQPETGCAHNADKPIQRGKAGSKAGKGRADGLAQPQQLYPEASANGQTVRRADFQAKPADKQVRGVYKRQS